MWIRAGLMIALMLLVFGRAGDCVSCYSRIGNSLRTFQESYQALEQPGPCLNTVDRVVLSLILSDSGQPRK